MYRIFHSKKRRISFHNLSAAVHVVTVQEKRRTVLFLQRAVLAKT